MLIAPRSRLLGTLFALVLTGLSAPSASAVPVANGGFETGTFSGWTVFNQPGSAGDWFVYSGTTTPINNITVPAPPEGVHAAITDMNDPGTHILYQDLVLEPGFTHTLSMSIYYNNTSPPFIVPDTLDHTSVENQQFRVDVMRDTAQVDSVAPGQVLVPVFRTDPGEPDTLAPTTLTVDLTPYAGSTVRIRLAEVDNQGVLNAGVDDVKLTTNAACRGRVVTISGTDGADTLVGTSGADVILAGAGNDNVKALGGKDRVCAGDGNDVVSGGGGKDRVSGGQNNDKLKGKAGNDRLKGQAGKDALNGGSGTDLCKGGPGRDSTTKCEKGRA